MTGMTNYGANALLNWVTGQIPMPALPAVYLALFTAVGTDAGTGFTEVSSSGSAYARAQAAGTLTTNAATTTSSPTLGFASVPAWVNPGMSVYDVTSGKTVGTVQSVSSPNVTLTANAANAVNSGDTLSFSIFGNASGTAPSTAASAAALSFAEATANWGTVIAWGLYDAATGGNLLGWDFLGNFPWLPFEVASGTGPTWNVKANGYASNDPVVVTAEYGGMLPTASTGTFSGYNINFVASPTTDTIQVDTASGPTTPCVLTSSGSGAIRKIAMQQIPQNVTATFSAGLLTISAA